MCNKSPVWSIFESYIQKKTFWIFCLPLNIMDDSKQMKDITERVKKLEIQYKDLKATVEENTERLNKVDETLDDYKKRMNRIEVDLRQRNFVLRGIPYHWHKKTEKESETDLTPRTSRD